VPASSVLEALQAQGIIGGLDLGKIDDSLRNHLLVCTTELNSRTGIDRMVAALSGIALS
jgi:glycine dehydrogenase subunit 1